MIFFTVALLLTVAVSVVLIPRSAQGKISEDNESPGNLQATPSIGGSLTVPQPNVREILLEKPSIKEPATSQLVSPDVPMLLMRKNAGQNPKPPTLKIYARFRAQIDRCVQEMNQASAGMDVGLNSWFRLPGEAGEELSQHLIACAFDIQGPDQERVAMTLKGKGWSIVRQSNRGERYRHVHCQLEPAGYLTRLGIAAKDLV